MGLKRRTRDAYEVPLGRKIYKSRASYVLMAPFLILFLVFVVIPILSSVFLQYASDTQICRFRQLYQNVS